MTTWTPEEQKAHRKLWVEALRSGKYEQTVGALNKGGAMCCLGVACDVSSIGQWNPDGRYVVGAEEHGILLPIPVRDWLGLTDRFGSMGDNPSSASAPTLTGYNDDQRKSFAEIANVIESEPEGLIGNPDPEAV